MTHERIVPNVARVEPATRSARTMWEQTADRASRKLDVGIPVSEFIVCDLQVQELKHVSEAFRDASSETIVIDVEVSKKLPVRKQVAVNFTRKLVLRGVKALEVFQSRKRWWEVSCETISRDRENLEVFKPIEDGRDVPRELV